MYRETRRRILPRAFQRVGLARLPFQPDAQKPDIGLGRAVMGGGVAFHLAQNRIEKDVDLLLGMDLADAQVQRNLRQRDLRIATKEDGSAKDLRSRLEPVHDACGDEDRIMCRVAARHPRDRDAALALGEPEEAGFGERAHRLDPPAAASGEAGNGDKTQLGNGCGLYHLGADPVAEALTGEVKQGTRGNPSEFHPLPGKLPTNVPFLWV